MDGFMCIDWLRGFGGQTGAIREGWRLVDGGRAGFKGGGLPAQIASVEI